MAWQPQQQQQQQGPYDSPYSDAIPTTPLQNNQNGFKTHDVLDDDAFGAKGSIVSAFDAFRKLHSNCSDDMPLRNRRCYLSVPIQSSGSFADLFIL